jgi:isopenicillin-N epimerase
MPLTRRALLPLLASPALLGLRFPAARAAAAPEGAADARYWAALRAQFPIPLDQAYFNTGTLGSTPTAVLRCVAEDLMSVEVELARFDYQGGPIPIAGYQPEDAARAKLAALLGCGPDELALTQNATMGASAVAAGLDLSPGDEILITDREHPGGRSGWLARAARDGLVVTEVPVDPATDTAADILGRFEAAMGPRVRVVAVPHVTSAHGLVMPARELCALAGARGIFSALDGAQAPGQLPVDLRDLGCDAYYSSPHKWLLAPPGAGFLYLRPEAQGRIRTTLAGGQWDNLERGALRFQLYGTRNRSLVAGLEATLDFWGGLPRTAVFDRNQAMADQLRAGLAALPGALLLSSAEPGLAGPMVQWGLTGRTNREVMEALWERGRLRVRAVGKDGVRQCCHLYNSPAEIEATLAIARELLR